MHTASVDDDEKNTSQLNQGRISDTEGSHLTNEEHALIDVDRDAESRLRLKIDMYIVPTVALIYLFCYIDRSNIGNAKLAGFDRDLGLVGYEFNVVLSIYFVACIVFEIPCSLACKWIGPGWFLPAVTIGFGVCCLATAFVDNIHSVSGVRFLLGVFEAGMLPGIAYYLSRWYRRSELTFRLSLYIVTAPLAGAFGGLLASSILTLDHFGSLHSWRMLFAIEGIVTIGIGIISFVTLTDRPETAPWLTPQEKELAINRIKSERISSTEVFDAVDLPKILRGICSPVTLTTGVIFMFNSITVSGLAFFAPTIVQTIYPNTSVVSQQLHTVPPYIVGAFFTILIPYFSWKFDERLVFFIVSPPFTVAGYVMFLASDNSLIRYAATFLIASGVFSFGALCPAHVSANVTSDTARSSAIGTIVMFANIGGLISTWTFLPTDAPDYHIGNGVNLATAAMILILAVALRAFMIRDNQKRCHGDISAEMAGLSQRQIQDMDWKNPAFRWRL